VAQGYDPTLGSPSDVVPVPISRNVLMGTYFSRTGRFSRDALRCTASTIVSLPMQRAEPEAAEDYRLLAALAPVLAFLTDNTLRMRGANPHDCPRMARHLMWDETDPARCGLVPGSTRRGFGFEAYERWLEDVRPIVFTSDSGVTFSTGTDSCLRVMEERDLSAQEAERLLCTALPWVRWDGHLSLRVADALPTRQAGALVALVRGLLASELTRAATHEHIGLKDLDDDTVREAWDTLRAEGWNARVYGRPIAQIADELAAIASRGLEERDERVLLEELSQLWEVRVTPRDMLVANWERHREPTPEERAVQLYGEGAVIPFEELDGEPPAGSTAVMRTDRIKQALRESQEKDPTNN
jgi:glutamate--cysteine ligase